MTPKPTGVEITVSNRQRRWRVNTRLLARLAERVLELVHDNRSRLSIVLVDDAAIAKLNAQYHDTPGPTDILSFDYGDEEGELIISVEQAMTHARRYRSTPDRELVLYLVHGILHLHGHDDRTPPDRRRMRAAERQLMVSLTRDPGFHGLIPRRITGR